MCFVADEAVADWNVLLLEGLAENARWACTGGKSGEKKELIMRMRMIVDVIMRERERWWID